jgi:hypothetical protein
LLRILEKQRGCHTLKTPRRYYVGRQTLGLSSLRPPARLSLLHFTCWTSPCPTLRKSLPSYFFMNSACCLHYFLIKSYTHGILTAACNSRFGLRIGNLQVMRRTLFCRRCNLKRRVSALLQDGGVFNL